ncbi:MAG: phage terminase large subunit, partial [Pseudomonadales bacterium]|nr:phage terminase large subunit [Pseudomonadales bacterium]
NSIDYSSADPNDIKEVHIAMQILSHLKTQDKSIIEELYYMQLMENFGIEEEDPTELTREEKKFVASSFKYFVRYMFLVEYGFRWKANWHHDLLCDTLENLFLGKLDCPRIIINIPPRYSKTQLLIYFIAWTMGHVPDSQNILIGYSKMLSMDSSSKVRDILTNEKYLSIFPIELDKSSKAKDDFKTKQGGSVYATSTGGTLTGKGAGKMRISWGGCIVCDDPNNTLDAFSETQRDNANSWFANTLLSRRNNMAHTPIIVIQQRVHENDISGFLTPTDDNPLGGVGEDFTHINVPAILNKEDLETLKVPMDSPTRLEGDPEKDEYPLWAEKIPLAKLRNMKENLPILTFFGQYMQQPFATDGTIIKSSWMMPRPKPRESEIKYRVFILDTAQTKTNRSDWSVILVAAVLTDNSVFIENIHRERMEAPDLADQVLKMFRVYKPMKIYIEYKSSGIGLIQYLKREKIPLPISPIPRNASAGDGDSLVRASAVSTYIKCGYVSYLENAPWVPTFMHEIMAFPTGTHDDQVDCLVDLVAREVVPNGTALHDMSVDNLPLKDSTYEKVVQQEEIETVEDFINHLDTMGINYRGKKKQESNEPDWAAML